MSVIIFSSVIFAALLHASWNALIKMGDNKQTGMLILSLGHALCGLLVVVWRPLPSAEVIPWILASGLIHTAYQLFLAYAYEQGDLSRVYPLARGGAPLMVLLVSMAFGIDTLQTGELIGVLVLGFGIFMMARGVLSSGENRRLLPFAAGSALATAGYSLVDGMGARVSGDAIAYVGWLMMVSCVFYTPAIIYLRGSQTLRATAPVWRMGLLAAALSYFAYAIAVWAMTQAPIALVTALRETSILFAVLIGWLAFGEHMDRQKALAAALIILGVVLTRL